MQITSGQQYNVGEKPTVILYIYITVPSSGTLSPKILYSRPIVIRDLQYKPAHFPPITGGCSEGLGVFIFL